MIPTSQPPVLVLGPPRFIGPLGTMRTLRPLGVRVYSIAHPRSLANASRYCSGSFPIRTPGTAADADVLSDLVAAGRKLGAGTVLVPGSDDWSVFVARHADALAATYVFPAQPLPLIDGLASKLGLFELATRHDLPTPRILVPRDEAALDAASGDMQYPVMLKPIVSRPGRQWLDLVPSRGELLPRYRAMGDTGNVLCQEYIPGEDTDVWVFNGYFDASSRCRAAFTGRKIRQYPAFMGLITLGVTEHNQIVIEQTQQFLSRVGYRGVVDIGFRFDARDGQYKVLDINPRLGGAFRLFVDNHGLDVMRAMYLDLTGRPVPAVSRRDGRKWMLEGGEILTVRHYRRERGLTWRSWLRSLRGLEEGATFSLSDPLPFCVAMSTLVGETLRGRWGRLRRQVAQVVRRRRPARA